MGTRAWGGRVALTQACAASISAEDTLPADLAMTGSEAGGHGLGHIRCGRRRCSGRFQFVYRGFKSQNPVA